MNFEITTGKISKAQKVCIYGPEGIGKSTFASRFPEPLFIDTEGSTGNLDVKRLPKPQSWDMLFQEVNYVIEQRPCKTLIIDTIDWAEQLCIEDLLIKHGKKGIEDFGYGNGYVYEKESFARLLSRLEDVIAAGINVVLTAHAQIRKFSQPDEFGEYDRWELKLGKKTGSQISPLVKEWCDLLLFANYKTMAIAVDNDGKKFKAQGNARVMFTEHHACWDAKNRHGLSSELPFEFEAIGHLFVSDNTHSQKDKRTYWFDGKKAYITDGEKPSSERAVFQISKEEYIEACENIKAFEESETKKKDTLSAGDKLCELMEKANVSESEIRKVVSLRGYYPENTPIKNYSADFIDGVLVKAWEQVFSMICQQRELKTLPAETNN